MPTSFCETVRGTLREQLAENAYPGYVYGYPHKKAYRVLEAPLPLAEVWADEPRQALFAYVHIPFCNQRCSFCNLFTYVPGDVSPVAAYLDALAREMEAYATALGLGMSSDVGRIGNPSYQAPATFRRLYLGGGTPTFLTGDELRRLVGHLRDFLGIDPDRTEGCIETSPETVDQGKVEVLRELGFRRVSLGVQSLVPEELRQVNRRFDFAHNARAIDLIGRAGFPHFNIDLIYGLPGQDLASWRYSLEAAINSPATSLFLYPLYIRPLTGLDRRTEQLPTPTTREMGQMYDLAVARLERAGFRQVTMRQFRRDPLPEAPTDDLEYRCQRDGMVGLGAGARSYTRRLHYSTPWRMLGRNIRTVVEEYAARMRRGDTLVRHGFVLDDDEERRRFTILSLLHDGFDLSAFLDRFGEDAREVFPAEWEALQEEGLVEARGGALVLTARGVRHADVVGQVFFSGRVRALMDAYEYDS
jgi:oxygen-independent coproporphyrinogen-3 oxidase